MNEELGTQLSSLLLHAQRRSPVNRIASQLSLLRGKTRDVAQYLLHNINTIGDITVEHIAAACDTSRATVMRACNELGFQNFTQLKSDLLLVDSPLPAEDSALPSDPAFTAMKRCFSMLLDTFSTLDASRISEAAELLLSRRPIIVYGGAVSGGMARVVHNRLRWMGLHVYATSDTEQMTHELQRGTGVLFCISHIAGSHNVFNVLSQARRHQVPSVLLTNMESAPAVRDADIVLTTNITSYVTHGYDILARTAQLYMIELLCGAMETVLSNPEESAASRRP